jgi:hypothetical protein
MRVLIAALVLSVTASAAFAIGRTTAPDRELPPETGTQDITGRPNDVFRVPAIRLFCIVGYEIDQAKMLCNRTGDRPRYQVVFQRDRTAVGRIGYPGSQRVFPERP